SYHLGIRPASSRTSWQAMRPSSAATAGAASFRIAMALMARALLEASADLLGDRHAGGVALGRQGLGQDAERDLGRGLGAQVEPDRHPHPRERLLAHPVFPQQIQDGGSAPRAAEAPDVADRRAQR